MLLVLKKGCAEAEVERVVRLAEERGYRVQRLDTSERPTLILAGGGPRDAAPLEFLPGVDKVIPIGPPYRLAGREQHPADTTIEVGGVRIGGGRPVICAGPCAVENEHQVLETARRMKECGVDLLRGGAFKPRSSPYDFQGLGEDGLRLLAKARAETGLPIVTEAIGEASFDLVQEYADIVQIGARSMQNHALLRRAGRGRLPVFLKRGMAATLEDWLLSAEYVLAEGNPRVILCERGIRTFSTHSRFTLDLGVIPAVKSASHLPVFVDPSHATGHRERVPAMARAALAAGADGVMLEVHPDPSRALSDGTQALLPEQLASLVGDLRALASVLDRGVESAR